MLDLTADWDFDAVGGLTLGADPVATAMLHAAAAGGRELDAFVVRKEGKAHGLQRRVEGPDVRGRRGIPLGVNAATGPRGLAPGVAPPGAGAPGGGGAGVVVRAPRRRPKGEGRGGGGG